MWIGSFLLILLLAVALLPWQMAAAMTILDWLLGAVIYFVGIKGKFEILRCVPAGQVQTIRKDDDEEFRKAA